MDQVTTQSINFLQWHRDGGLVAVVEFPAGTPCERIATWRERVAANRGAVVEVYAPNPTPPVSPERMDTLRRKMVAARLA
jgi:hypothetical protein